MRPQALIAGIVATAIGGAIAAAPGAFASKPSSGGSTCHKNCPAPSPSPTPSPTTPPPDTTAPTASISSPAAGATVSGTVSASGTASDNVSVSRVDVQVDGGSWQQATGTTSWTFSWDTTTLTDGTHTLVARATDTSGNTGTASESVSVSNSTGSTGGSTGSGGSTGGSTTAPNTQGSWVSPEGVHINVNSAGPWTISQVYNLLLANGRDLNVLGPDYTINVQDTYASMTTASYSSDNGVYGNFTAVTWLKGVNSTFASTPDNVFTHEFGEAWAQYWWVTKHQASWADWESMRYDQSTYNGTTYPYLASDPRLGTGQAWDATEIIADDYRLLFGSSAAISEHPASINTTITDPRNQPGLGTFLLQQWA